MERGGKGREGRGGGKGLGRGVGRSAPQAKAWPPELFSWRRRC